MRARYDFLVRRTGSAPHLERVLGLSELRCRKESSRAGTRDYARHAVFAPSATGLGTSRGIDGPAVRSI
jgi:hypothetical protein